MIVENGYIITSRGNYVMHAKHARTWSKTSIGERCVIVDEEAKHPKGKPKHVNRDFGSSHVIRRATYSGRTLHFKAIPQPVKLALSDFGKNRLKSLRKKYSKY